MPKKTKETKKDMEDPEFQPFFPGIEDIVMDILHTEAVITIKEHDTDREAMYYFNKPVRNRKGELSNPDLAGIYTRGEEELKEIAEQTFKEKLKEMSELCDEVEPDKDGKNPYAELQGRIDRKLKHDGIKTHEVNEILNNFRRKTFTDREKINPGGFIPLNDGFYDLKTHELREFNASHFYTWKVHGTFDPAIRSLRQIPIFMNFLIDVFYPQDIPLILDYMAYCLYPEFPRQKILAILGEARRGKGTLTRILEKMIREGYGNLSLFKLLAGDNRFALQGIEGKNLLVDPEIKRNYHKEMDFSIINSLFGGDTVLMEKKFKAGIDYKPKSKGILVGNIPLFYVNDPAFLSRLLIVVPKPKPKGWKEITDLDNKIWDAEGSNIVAFLLSRLKGLLKRNFRFANELTNEEYAEMWHNMCDSPKMFAEQEMESSHENVIVETAYDLYVAWCETKNIPPEGRKRFSYEVGKMYPIKRQRINGEPTYVFSDCSLSFLVMEVKISKPQTNDDDDELDGIL